MIKNNNNNNIPKFTIENSYNFSLPHDEILMQFNDMINILRLNKPKNSTLWLMPSIIVLSGGNIGFRSVSKQFIIDDNINDFGSIIKNLNNIINTLYLFYEDSGEELENNNVHFQYWYREKELCNKKLLNKINGKVVDYLKNDNTLRLNFEQKHLNILPSLFNYTYDRINEIFLYKGYKYKISNIDSPVLNEFWINKLIESKVNACVELIGDNEDIILVFKDYIINEDEVIRVLWRPHSIDKPSIYIINKINYNISYYEVPLKTTNYISKLKSKYTKLNLPKVLYEDRKIGVFDVETFSDKNGELIPYAIGSLVGGEGNFHRHRSELKTYYLTDFEGETVNDKVIKMLYKWLSDILIIQNRGYKFYAHNLSGFDGHLLLKYLSNIDGLKLKPIINNNKIYSLTIIMNVNKMDSDWLKKNIGPRGGTSKLNENDKIRIVLNDSYLLLPLSLKDLCRDFNLKTQKGEFPHEFVNINNLNYCGKNPLNNDSVELWSLKKACLDYLSKDLKSLYEVMMKFDKKILNNFRLNIYDYISLPSLSMAIYRSLHMPKNAKIPILRGKCESDIRKAYTGGCVEVYYPILEKGYCYDMTSQYPAAMLQDMPIGNPIYCYKPSIDDFFGFIRVDVETPNDLIKPFLQTKINGKLVSPIGKFSGWFFSESIKVAKNLGYKFKVYEGYKFERGKDIFKSYVEFFFEQKANAKTKGDRLIYKLFLNSLYGKFGMKDKEIETELMNSNKLSEITKNHEIKNIYNLGFTEDKFITSYVKEPDSSICQSDITYTKLLHKCDNNRKNLNSSVAIAAAITAYARISIYEFVKESEVAYTDTDCIFTSNKLSDYMVTNELGKMKLEYTFNKAIFVKPKVYFIEKTNGEKIFKFKGVPKNLIKEEDYLNLYNGNKVIYNITKLIRQKGGGIKKIKSNLYIMPPDNSKRIMIVNNNKWINTKPINISIEHPPDNIK